MVKKEPTTAKNANSRGKKSAATKKKQPTTTKEVRATASLARQLLVGPSASTNTPEIMSHLLTQKRGIPKECVC